MTVASPSFAQDVVMRRPLPTKTVESVQTDCAITNSCPTPTPTEGTPDTPPPTPAPSTPAPTPGGPPEIVTEDPVVPVTVTNPGTPDEYGWVDYHWQPGPWSGSAQCGVQSTMTRQIGCVGTFYGYESEQLGDFPVDASLCQENAYGDPPGNTYHGDTAGCGYHYTQDGYTDWQRDWDYPGTATCSDGAYKDQIVNCRNASGTVVNTAYCQEALDPGGQQSDSSPPNERYHGVDTDGDGVGNGNHESCTASWQEQVGAKECNGSSYQGQVTYACVQADGRVLTGVDEAKCPIGEKPLDHTQTYGSCIQSYDYYSNPGKACLAPDKKDRLVTFAGSPWDGGYDACLNAGATCCQYRYNNTKGAYETVGTAKQPDSVGYGYYNDDGESYQCWATWECRDLNGDGFLNDGDACWFPVGEAMTCYQNYQRVSTFGASTKLWVPDWSTIH